MTRPAYAPAAEDTMVPQPAVRRNRFRLMGGLMAVLAIAALSTACTPREAAELAIQEHWGKDAACAMRIADRESNFEAEAVNPRSGTTGLFQLHPVHKAWITKRFGYDFAQLKDPMKNAQVARALSYEAAKAYGDGWQPWRLGGKKNPGGGCPA